MRHGYDVEIQHIFVSEGHNYFKNPMGQPGDKITRDVEAIEAVAGMGLRGDRYFGYKKNDRGQITFFSAEVHAELLAALDDQTTSPELYRRNVVIAGVALSALIGKRFQIGDVLFEGTEHCTPCKWMDSAFGKGALKFLHGRGGLRARILEGGMLVKGSARLLTDEALNDVSPTAPLVRAALPG